ncbi:MAG: alpha/beta fold hydrolase [Proteobacteria bacterium]|nr:MAG: alpha/beta fold hydrolase [Pseudomonadota bacterium]
MLGCLTLPFIQGLALLASILLGTMLHARESSKDKDKRKPCQVKDGTWLECPEPSSSGVSSDYVFRPADKSKKSKSPLVLLAGGPGQSASEGFIPLPPMIQDLSREYDLIFFNPRGTTGKSKLKCPSPETIDLKRITDRTYMADEAKSCLKSLGSRFNLSDFGTDASLADLDKIREELGYEKLSFYGVSYGTRLALRYAALYPDRTDKMVLEGVLPPHAFIGQDTYALEPVLKRLSTRCSEAVPCAKAYGDVYESYQKLRSDFAKPRTLDANHPRTGKKTAITLDINMIDGMLLQLLYTEFDQTLIPAILHQASGGNLNPLIASSFSAVRSPFYEGLYFAIACTEDAPFFDSTKLDARTEEFLDICLSYPFKPSSAKIHDPVRGPWPTLLLSGELDPVTPPELIKSLKTDLTNAKHFVIPNKGHNVFYLRCVGNQIKEFFLDRKSDRNCEEQKQPLPFYIEETKR